jgi:hypothetical protein
LTSHVSPVGLTADVLGLLPIRLNTHTHTHKIGKFKDKG